MLKIYCHGFSLSKAISHGSKILAALFVTAAILIPANAQSPDPRPEQCLGGQLDAPIRVEVYSDYQCPACRDFYVETVKQVLKDYCATDKVCLIYYEFPLAMHQYAREAARYSLAAQRLGRKQWQAVVDSLYSNQPQWSLDGRLEAAVSQAVSPEEFQKIKKILVEPSIDEAIAREIADGQKRDVKSTPTVFVTALRREQRVEGGVIYQVLKDFIDRIVK